MKNELAIPPDLTEAQLQALIAECQHIIHDLVLPAARAVESDAERRRYLDSVTDLVRIGAHVGDVIARLRGHVPANETRQRIVVERIEKSPALIDIPEAMRAAARRAYPPADKTGEGVS